MDIENNDLNLEKLKDYKAEFNSFLIKSYSKPFNIHPSQEEIKQYIEFMDYVADYLCLIVEKSNKRPLISVIMPVYNRKNIVLNSINSVLSQSYDNFELIIIDDASTDGTTELLKEINHEKIRVLFHSKNKDCSCARNTGLKEAKGEFITYLDSDNIMDKKFLQSNLGAFLIFSEASCIYSAQIRRETYNSPVYSILFGSLNKSGLLYRNFVDTNTIFHKKSILDKVGGFDETLKRGEDWDFILRIVNNFKVYSIPFLQSKYFTKLTDDRITETRPNEFKTIREKNAKFYTDALNLRKKINIIIPIHDTCGNIIKCLNSIFSLDLNNKIKVIISNNNPQINLDDLILDKFENHDIEIIETKTNLGFSDSLENGINHSDKHSDLLILDKNAILTKGALNSMQIYAYSLNNCGLISSEQLVYNPPLLKKYFNYVNEEYWIDITPFKFEQNIIEVPLVYDGEFLEIKIAPFFATYLKRDVIKQMEDFNFKFKDSETTMVELSKFIRNDLNLKIFTTSNAKIFQYSKHMDVLKL